MKRQEYVFKILRKINSICVAALLVGAALLFYACENNIEQIKAFASPENLPIMEAKDFQTMRTDSGKISFSLKAPRVLRYNIEGKEFTEFPEGIEIVKYNSNNKIVSSITADYAKQYANEDKWEAKNNVIVTNINGDSLKTELLNWKQETGEIYTDDFVKIISPDRIVTGLGFSSDEKMINWKIKEPKGIIYVTLDRDQEPQQNGTTSSLPEPLPIQRQQPNQPLEFDK
ncbi:MAG: LPS export ABC transporter periplasmic protein LptC [Draconibacterium sp.]|nr:MAG: LPS export ABC transporter periplasmic protein LptC [Draconibacterium sp.]